MPDTKINFDWILKTGEETESEFEFFGKDIIWIIKLWSEKSPKGKNGRRSSCVYSLLPWSIKKTNTKEC